MSARGGGPRSGSRQTSLAERPTDFNRAARLFADDLPGTIGCVHGRRAAAPLAVTLALVALAAVVFTALVGVVHTVTERRRVRRSQEQWEERERLLDREP